MIESPCIAIVIIEVERVKFEDFAITFDNSFVKVVKGWLCPSYYVELQISTLRISGSNHLMVMYKYADTISILNGYTIHPEVITPCKSFKMYNRISL